MPLNVLVTAVSRRVPLVKAFRHALNALGVRGTVIATDVNPLSPGVHFCDRAYQVPLSSDPGYLDSVTELCEAEGIGLIVPTIDEELPLFASVAARFARRGIKVAVSSEETTLICNDKYTTCTYLRDAGIAAAESFLPHTMPDQPRLPMFIKPRRGRGSIGAVSVSTKPHLDFFLGYVADPVVQEYLTGPEYTIDLMCDFNGRPLSIVPRQRVVIRSGVIDRGRTVNDQKLIDLAVACADALSFAGPINIQCRTVNGRPTVFEINPRFSGGIPLTIAAGADFPRMLLQLALGRRVEPSIGCFKSDLWMTSYEASVFVDHISQLLPIPKTADLETAAAA
ncbi:MAG: ATP-grasp domain-containing protein [Acidobacteria bacterium]|jgi:carbamoyl-phosphate synthase large subunit|nr:ATP-grasp domain-containing protein [Acidobacteriota bacterium]